MKPYHTCHVQEFLEHMWWITLVLVSGLPGIVVIHSFTIFSVKYVPTWFPGANFKRTATRWRRTVRDMLDRPFNMVKERMVEYQPVL
jgi:hypothetical protein